MISASRLEMSGVLGVSVGNVNEPFDPMDVVPELENASNVGPGVEADGDDNDADDVGLSV